MISTDLIEVPASISGSGLEGVWLGIRGTPFSEAFKRRKNMATWLLEGAWQSADETNFWTVANGQRGGGPGGSAWRVRSAFSTTHGISNPYLDFTWTTRRPFRADLTALDGSLLGTRVELNPADEISVLAGTELCAHDNPAAHTRFLIDLRLGYAYHSWRTMQSGLLLPSILSSSEGLAVTESEYQSWSGGLGFIWQTFQYMQLNLRGEASYLTPHRIEHPYPVRTGADDVAVGVSFGMKVMVRTPDTPRPPG
jgi:hypothetical protein